MPMRAQILSAFIEPDEKSASFLGKSRRPAVMEDFAPSGWRDATDTPAKQMPPVVPLLILEGVWEDAVFAALLADPRYAKAVLWSDQVSEEGAIALKGVEDVSAQLTDVFGVASDQVDVGLADIALGDERGVVAQKLADWLASQQKAV